MHDPDDLEVRQHRGIREVEAESVALMIGAAHGMTTDGYTIPYVSTWAARADDKEPAQIVQVHRTSGCGRRRWRSSSSSTPHSSVTAPSRSGTRHSSAKPARAAARQVEPDWPHLRRSWRDGGCDAQSPRRCLAALIRVDRTQDLAAAARGLLRLGCRWHMPRSGGKRPLTRRGFLGATCDPGQVAAW